jgi:hypothetical protein
MPTLSELLLALITDAPLSKAEKWHLALTLLRLLRQRSSREECAHAEVARGSRCDAEVDDAGASGAKIERVGGRVGEDHVFQDGHRRTAAVHAIACENISSPANREPQKVSHSR